MPIFFLSAAPNRPTTPPPEDPTPLTCPSASSLLDTTGFDSTWDLLSTPLTSRAPSPSPLTRTTSVPCLSNCSSWDGTSFSDKSHLLPGERNGNFQTSVAEAVRHPITALAAANEALRLQNIRNGIANAVEAATESIQDSLTHALDGHDLPAMHDKVMDLIPSVSMPTMREVSRSVDVLSDRVMGLAIRVRVGSGKPFLEEEVASDHLAFAQHMGAKAKQALINQRICRQWQVLSTRATLHWQTQLNAALVRVYNDEKDSFTVAQPFAMKPVWVGDVEGQVWRLELDTGMVEIVVEYESDEFEEKNVTLDVGFALPERCGCVAVADVERGVVSAGEGDWMAVQEVWMR